MTVRTETERMEARLQISTLGSVACANSTGILSTYDSVAVY